MSSDPIKEVDKFTKDPQRAGLALLTGGMSESVRFVANEANLAVERMMPEEPSLEKAKAPPTDADPALTAAKAEVENKNKQGRASTILTGPKGLSNSTVNLSRRTLLGA